MRPKKQFETPDLFRARLDQILDNQHPLFKLANQIDWLIFENEFGATYDQKMGRPAIPIRVMVALHYLKYTFNLSDEQTVETFVENGYWQYFCGFEFFQHKAPTDPSNMTRFRKRIGDKGIEKLLSNLIHTALKMGALKESDLQRINVDTTVMEKAISFPTDANLYYKMRKKLVSLAKERDVELRQSYVRVARQALIKHSRYAHAKQYKRAARERRKLKTYLGRVTRDLFRKVENPDQELLYYLRISNQILSQSKTSKNKIYSIHAPEVECISKGKAHKRYEFGVKVGISSTSKGNWVIGAQSFRGNPYDGHTLAQSVKQTERLTGKNVEIAYVDLGYRGHNYQGHAQINIVDNRKMKKLTRSERRWFKRRSAIEPIIGHLKSDNRMSRNFLKGAEGDLNNALLCACGFNMRKLLAVFFLPFSILSKYHMKSRLIHIIIKYKMRFLSQNQVCFS
jgi:IS5 family transposase